MKAILLVSILHLSIFAGAQQISNAKSYEKEVSSLLKKMTIEEKIAQLKQPYYTKPDRAEIDKQIAKKGLGSILFTARDIISPEERNATQRIAVEESRLGIPILFGYDVIHGYSTIFPSSLGMASSWDEDLVKSAAAASADEAAHWGVDMAFSPMVDVSRDPRWGRISECAGEDVLLNSRLGAAFVKGLQGESLADESSVASCVKHFVGYGASMGGRDKAYTEISKRSLHEIYLPPFKACVDAGAQSIMTAFNDVSGVPSTANDYTINHILKKEWGFDGLVLSDWDAVVELQNHGISSNEKESAIAAINAGVDMEMKSHCYDNLIEAIKEKKVSMKTIDDAVKRVLRLKFRLGLFDNPYVDVTKGYAKQLTKENRSAARLAAAESMILLKNTENTLPLKPETSKTHLISVVGPMAHSFDMIGYWIGIGKYSDVIRPYDGIKANAPKDFYIMPGTERRAKRPISIVCIGEAGDWFGESGGQHSIEPPRSQVELVKECKKLSSKVVVVVFSGRPLVLTEILPYADAVVQAWHPGTEAGNAVADILFGKVNPSGKAPASFLKSTGQTPVFYSDRVGGRPTEDKYELLDGKPLFPFGFGLSYSTFEYTDFSLSANTMKAKNDSIKAKVTVKNTSNVKGKEVVQLYIHDLVASHTVPQQQLIDFKKVEIEPNQSIEVEFTIVPSQLALVNEELDWVVEKGDFDIMIGGASNKTMKEKLTIK